MFYVVRRRNKTYHALRRTYNLINKIKNAVETGYFATIGGGGQYDLTSQAVGSSPKSGPPTRVRLLLLDLRCTCYVLRYTFDNRIKHTTSNV